MQTNTGVCLYKEARVVRAAHTNPPMDLWALITGRIISDSSATATNTRACLFADNPPVGIGIRPHRAAAYFRAFCILIVTGEKIFRFHTELLSKVSILKKRES